MNLFKNYLCIFTKRIDYNANDINDVAEKLNEHHIDVISVVYMGNGNYILHIVLPIEITYAQLRNTLIESVSNKYSFIAQKLDVDSDGCRFRYGSVDDIFNFYRYD